MTVFVSDTFTDTNGVLLQNHTPDIGEVWLRRDVINNLNIQSNALKNTSAFGNSSTYTNATSSSVDYDITCTIIAPAPGSVHTIRVFGRFVDINNYYRVEVRNNTSWLLRKVVAGVFTNLSTVAPAAHTYPFTFKFEIRDATKKAYKDGVEVLTSADNALTAAGRPGISFVADTLTVDNFVADDAGAPVSENASMMPIKAWWAR